MKIDGNAPNTPAQPVGAPTDDVRTRPAGSSEKTIAPRADTVQLSPQAQLAGKALHAASEGPSVREDKVEQAKQKLASGELGKDPLRLADRIIDHLLEG